MINYNNLFYFDIETVGKYKSLSDLKSNDERGYELFMSKYVKQNWATQCTPEEAYTKYAPLLSTFGKVVCVSFGYFHNKNAEGYTIDSICGDDEAALMVEVRKLFTKVSSKHMFICGYNILTFDVPWLQHKMYKYGLSIPPVLRTYGKKPWEVSMVDLFKEWNSINRYYTTFDEVSYELDIPSPKEDMDGSKVHESYWVDHDLDNIKRYCECDVKASLMVGKQMLNMEL